MTCKENILSTVVKLLTDCLLFTSPVSSQQTEKYIKIDNLKTIKHCKKKLFPTQQIKFSETEYVRKNKCTHRLKIHFGDLTHFHEYLISQNSGAAFRSSKNFSKLDLILNFCYCFNPPNPDRKTS